MVNKLSSSSYRTGHELPTLRGMFNFEVTNIASFAFASGLGLHNS